MNADVLTQRGNCTSASNALADSLCPGRFQAQLGLPEPEASEEAKSGTRIHEWLARHFRGDYMGICNLSSDELEVANVLKEKIEAFGFDFAKRNKMSLNYNEHRMWIQLGELSHSGQVDLILVDGISVAILDFKTGWNDVPDSDTNLQLRDLAVLAWRNFPKIKSVEVAIIDRFREPVVTRYEIEDLRRSEKELKARVKASNAKNARRIPGPIQCKYCRAFGTERCPESTRLASTLIRTPAYGELKMVPANKLVEIESLRPLVTKLCATVTSEIRRRLQEDPASVPGASLAKPKVLKPITNPELVFIRAMDLGVEREDVMKSVKMSKGPLEEVVRESLGLKGKELDAKMNELLAGCTTEKACEPEILID